MKKQIIFPLLFIFSGLANAVTPLANLFVVPEVARHIAPDFVLENLHGGRTGLTDYKGRIVVLNFWVTWCMPCRAEMPGMETLWQKYKEQGLVIAAVSVDEGSKRRIENFQNYSI